MVAGWAVVLSALVYLCLLFAIAHWGDYAGRRILHGSTRSTVAALSLGGLLHVLDLLRFGRPCHPVGARLPGHLYRAHPGHRARPYPRGAGRAGRENAEHLVDRGFRGGAIRQERAGRGAGHGDRPGGLDSLHRPSAQGRLGIPRRVPHGRERGRAADDPGDRRPRPRRRHRPGLLRRRLRHPPHGRDGASGRADGGDLDGVDRQARGLPDRRGSTSPSACSGDRGRSSTARRFAAWARPSSSAPRASAATSPSSCCHAARRSCCRGSFT